MAGSCLKRSPVQPLAKQPRLQALAAADACAEEEVVGIGGWAVTSSQMVCFAETWTMQDVRRVWPCLVKPAQRYIACFETLAQLALLQATRSHIGGGRYSFSILLPLGRMPKTFFCNRLTCQGLEQESPCAFRPPPSQSRALQPCQPCTNWKGHHTLPRRVTTAPRTSGCSRRACVTYGLLAVRLLKASVACDSSARAPSAFRTAGLFRSQNTWLRRPSLRTNSKHQKN